MFKWKIREGAAEAMQQILIFSAASILLTRLYLNWQGWPEIGKGVWHISHALTGGSVMFAGVLMLLVFEGGKSTRWALAIIGIGWGWFIDELGKLITRDYNYFFRPAVMMIYIVFVMLLLGYKYLRRRESHNVDKFGFREKWLRKIVSRRQLMWGLLIYSLYYSIEKIWEFFNIIATHQKLELIRGLFGNYQILGTPDVILIYIKMVIDASVSILFLAGARHYWFGKRLTGLRYFRHGLLMSILLGSIIRFYFEEMGGVGELLVSWIILEILNQYQKEIIVKTGN